MVSVPRGAWKSRTLLSQTPPTRHAHWNLPISWPQSWPGLVGLRQALPCWEQSCSLPRVQQNQLGDSSNEMSRSHPQSFFTQCRPNNLHVERVPKWYRRYWSRDGTLRTSDAGLRMGWVGRRCSRCSRCPWPWVSDWSLCQKTCLWQMKCWLRQVFYFLSAYHKNCFLRSMGLKRILLSFL